MTSGVDGRRRVARCRAVWRPRRATGWYNGYVIADAVMVELLKAGTPLCLP